MGNKEMKSVGVPCLPIHEIVGRLVGMWSGAVEAGMPFDSLPSVMLWGPPGAGKSQAVRQIADGIGQRTGKRVHVTDVRLLLFNPIDLRGIPVANEERTLAVWLRPKVFDMDASPDVVNILLLDEISAAPQSVQAAAYQITLDRTCGEHKLPQNCVVIAAGNRVTDKSVAYRMPKALANRLLHLETRVDSGAWLEWARPAGIHPLIMGFICARPDMLMRFDASDGSMAFPTPRTWEMASGVLRGSCGDLGSALPLIAGLVGEGAAIELKAWASVFSSLPSMEDIFSGKRPAVPKEADATYALVSAMATYAREHRDDLDAIGRSLDFARSLPPDFRVVLLHDYLAIEPGYREKLARLPEFVRMINESGAMLNGIV